MKLTTSLLAGLAIASTARAQRTLGDMQNDGDYENSADFVPYHEAP